MSSEGLHSARPQGGQAARRGTCSGAHVSDARGAGQGTLLALQILQCRIRPVLRGC